MDKIIEVALIIALFLVVFYVFYIRPYVLAKKEFKCRRCGNCCSLRVRPSKEEIKKIKRKGHKNFLNWLGFIKRKNKFCIFLKFEKNKAKCYIYKIRPKICKTFPISNSSFGEKIDVRCKNCYGKLW